MVRMRFVLHSLHYLRFVSTRFAQDRCLTIAGSLTYTSLLAVVPLFTLTLVIAAQVPATRELILRAKALVLSVVIPEVGAGAVTDYMQQFAENAANLTTIGALMIAATALLLLFTIDEAFNDIWRTRRTRSMIKRLAAYSLLLVVGPVLVGASLSITSYVSRWTERFGVELPWFEDVWLTIVPFLLTSAALALAYLVIPKRHVPLRHAIAGGIFAGLLFELTKHGFVAYVSRMPTYDLVYGAFASFPIFLLWLYCCWMVVLIGAEVTATFSYFRHVDAHRPDASRRLQNAMRLVEALSATPDAVEVALDLTALRQRAPMPIEEAEDLLDALVHADVVRAERKSRRLCYRLQMRADTLTPDLLAPLLEQAGPLAK